MNHRVKLRALAPLLLIALAFACSGGDSSGDDPSPSGDGDGDASPGDGDGDMGGAPGGDGDGDGGMGGASGGDGDGELVSQPTSPDCNLSGVWAVVAKTVTSAAGGEQIANRWYLYEISQQGNDVEVVRSLDCKVRVENSGGVATEVTISDDALVGILENNPRGGLKGTFSQEDGNCLLDFDREYTVLGLASETYLPEDPSTRPPLDTLPALPTEAEPAGAEDWDGDGTPGLLFNVTTLGGFLTGSRNSVQRGFIEFDSDESNPDYTIALGSTIFTVNNSTAIEEVVMAASSDTFKTLGTLEGSDHPVTFTRLGNSRSAARLPSDAAIPEDDLEACLALEQEFPYSQ